MPSSNVGAEGRLRLKLEQKERGGQRGWKTIPLDHRANDSMETISHAAQRALRTTSTTKAKTRRGHNDKKKTSG